MTTIHLSERTGRNDGQYQVFGSYDGEDDRYVFGVAEFATLAEAEEHARKMMARRPGAKFERITD